MRTQNRDGTRSAPLPQTLQEAYYNLRGREEAKQQERGSERGGAARAEKEKKKKKSTQAFMRTAVCTHTSAAMRALTQLTQAGVSVSSEPKRWHARAAASTPHNKTCPCQSRRAATARSCCVFPSFFSRTCGVWMSGGLLSIKDSRVPRKSLQTAAAKNRHVKKKCTFKEGGTPATAELSPCTHRGQSRQRHTSVSDSPV